MPRIMTAVETQTAVAIYLRQLATHIEDGLLEVVAWEMEPSWVEGFDQQMKFSLTAYELPILPPTTVRPKGGHQR